jgi:hypothetical protein
MGMHTNRQQLRSADQNRERPVDADDQKLLQTGVREKRASAGGWGWRTREGGVVTPYIVLPLREWKRRKKPGEDRCGQERERGWAM